MDPEPVVASQEYDSFSVVSRSARTTTVEGWQAGPILAGSYPVQGGDIRYGPVCARVRRAFVPLSVPDVPCCAGPSAGVLHK